LEGLAPNQRSKQEN